MNSDNFFHCPCYIKAIQNDQILYFFYISQFLVKKLCPKLSVVVLKQSLLKDLKIINKNL